jgi:glycosyltransferase involved in cell wall biosynthesis
VSHGVNALMKISILIPTYNGAKTIREALRSILPQSHSDFEIVVQDNASTDGTRDLVARFTDPRIRYFCNAANLGVARNMIEGAKNCTGEILYLFGSDDILGREALKRVDEGFRTHPEIGAMTTARYGFKGQFEPASAMYDPPDFNHDSVLTLDSPPLLLDTLFGNIGQISGMAFRISMMRTGFFVNEWSGHLHPFFAMLTEHPVLFLKDYNVILRTESSFARNRQSPIYRQSPILAWVEMYETVLAGPHYGRVRNILIGKVARKYAVLVQIAIFGDFRYLLREIGLLIVCRPANLVSPSFWFHAAVTILLPRGILYRLVEWYKNRFIIPALLKRNRQIEYDLLGEP